MTPDEQFAALNTPDWLTAFRAKVSTLWDVLAAQNVHVPSAQFQVSGVDCNVVLVDGQHARAQIGSKDGGGWLIDILAPIGWFRPATP